MGRSSLGIGMDLVEDTEDGRYSSASHAPEPSPQRSPSPFHLHLSAVPSRHPQPRARIEIFDIQSSTNSQPCTRYLKQTLKFRDPHRPTSNDPHAQKISPNGLLHFICAHLQSHPGTNTLALTTASFDVQLSQTRFLLVHALSGTRFRDR